MVVISCPWCDEDVALPVPAFTSEPVFTCPACATTVALVDDVEEPSELAA
jgi:hypothetical protein